MGLTLSERSRIYAYRKMKLSANQIAVKLGRAKSNIYDELQRVKHYNPDIAQVHVNKLRSHCSRHSLLSGAIISTLSNNLKSHNSPEGISHAYGIGINTIYQGADEQIKSLVIVYSLNIVGGVVIKVNSVDVLLLHILLMNILIILIIVLD